MKESDPYFQVKKYKKRPVTIEAVQLTQDNQFDVAMWCGGTCYFDQSVKIHTLEGVMSASIGDYVIKGVAGEYYPCREDIFLTTYEELSS